MDTRAQLTIDHEIGTIKINLIPLDIITLTLEEFESVASLAAPMLRVERFCKRLNL